MKTDLIDNEAVMLVQEKNDEAKNVLFEKYKYIIDIILRKYERVIYKLGIDKKDIYSEALFSFSEALNSYNPDREASIATFITLCVERKVIKCIRSASNNSNQFNREAYSLDYVYDEFGFSLSDVISDNNKFDPLNKLTNIESTMELFEKIKESLSKFELEVFTYMIQGVGYIAIAELLGKEPKQIDNTMQRIKNKVKMIINA